MAIEASAGQHHDQLLDFLNTQTNNLDRPEQQAVLAYQGLVMAAGEFAVEGPNLEQITGQISHSELILHVSFGSPDDRSRRQAIADELDVTPSAIEHRPYWQKNWQPGMDIGSSQENLQRAKALLGQYLLSRANGRYASSGNVDNVITGLHAISSTLESRAKSQLVPRQSTVPVASESASQLVKAA